MIVPVAVFPGPRFVVLVNFSFSVVHNIGRPDQGHGGNQNPVQTLMFRVCDMLHVSRPAASTAAALVALLRGWTITTLINNRGPMGPGVAGLAVIF